MFKAFTQHPESVNESYFQHMGASLCFCGKFFLGMCIAFIHAFFPFLFVKTGSKIVTEMHDCMVANREKHQKNDHTSLRNFVQQVPEDVR